MRRRHELRRAALVAAQVVLSALFGIRRELADPANQLGRRTWSRTL